MSTYDFRFYTTGSGLELVEPITSFVWDAEDCEIIIASGFDDSVGRVCYGIVEEAIGSIEFDITSFTINSGLRDFVIGRIKEALDYSVSGLSATSDTGGSTGAGSPKIQWSE